MARLTGDPAIVFIRGRLATIPRLGGLLMSMIDGVFARHVADGLPGLVGRYLLVVTGDQELRPGPYGRRNQPTGRCARRQQPQESFMVSSRLFALLMPVFHSGTAEPRVSDEGCQDWR
jgi:hypothetical protein